MDGKSVIGMDAIERRFDDLSDAAQDISPTFGTLAAKFSDREDSVFSSNGCGKWAPRAPSTIKEGVSPLVQTGIMRDRLTRQRAIWKTKRGAAFGAAKYDRRVERGHPARVGTSRMPTRMVVPPLRAAEKRDWLDVVRKHMGKAID